MYIESCCQMIWYQIVRNTWNGISNISNNVWEKKVTEIPQWSGNVVSVTALWSLAAVLLFITQMTCCRRLRDITVSIFVCKCMFFVPISETVTVPVIKLTNLWHYSVLCLNLMRHLPLYLYAWSLFETTPGAIAEILIVVGSGNCDAFADRTPLILSVDVRP